MIHLFLSIICASAIFLIFKFFEKYHVDNSMAIAINYLVASLFGFFLIPSGKIGVITQQGWFIYAAIIGILFLFLFQLMALSTQKTGISATTIANKMGVVIPVIAAIFLYNDTLTILKISGILLALAGVYFSAQKKTPIKTGWKYLIFPVILSSITASLFLKEKLSKTNWFGIVVSITAIILIAISS